MSILSEMVLVEVQLYTPRDIEDVERPSGLTEEAEKAQEEGIKLLPSSRKMWINPHFVTSVGTLKQQAGISEVHLSGWPLPINVIGDMEEIAMMLMGETMEADDDIDDEGVLEDMVPAVQ